jgi:Flp pilus assembly protein TadG
MSAMMTTRSNTMSEKMKMKNQGLLTTLSKFRHAQAGVAAMEFALVVPIMFGLYFMINETANGLRASRKVTMMARILADLPGQATTVDDAYIADVFASGTAIIRPFDITKASMRITSIRFDATGKGYVDWSNVSGSGVAISAHQRCTPTELRSPQIPGLPTTPIAVPAGLKVANSSLIYGETFYKYRPVIGWAISGDIDMKQELFMVPRVGTFVTRTGAATTPACT